MKKVVSIVLALYLILGVFSGCSSDKHEMPSDIVSVETASSKPDTPQSSKFKEIDGMRYLDISGLPVKVPEGSDASVLFAEEADGEKVEGYYIEDGVYSLDRDTFIRVLNMPLKGNGAIKWIDYKQETYGNPKYMFDGVLPISRLDDPLYVSTCLPYEVQTYMTTEVRRRNASVLCDPEESDTNILSIAAVYMNNAVDIPNDTNFTLCIGRITCALKFKGQEDWVLVTDDATPDYPSSIYFLPWQLNNISIPSTKLPPECIKLVDGHYEISLKASDFKGYGHTDERVRASTFHFWATRHYFSEYGKTGLDIEGFVCSYEIWLKEEGLDGYLAAYSGADIRNADERTNQVFVGNSFAVTHEPRVVFGHNVAPENYDSVMNSEQVQDLIGIK